MPNAHRRLKFDHSLFVSNTSIFSCERARRFAVKNSSNLIARILINDKKIADTPSMYDNSIVSNRISVHVKQYEIFPFSHSRSLTIDFEAQFCQIFPCYVMRTPETIKVQLYESNTRSGSLIVELYLPIPETTLTSENYRLQAFEFSTDLLRQFNPKQTSAVGAGIAAPVQYNDTEVAYLNVEGLFKASVAWGVQDGVVLVPADYPTSKAFQE
jgi:hypothetical protein